MRNGLIINKQYKLKGFTDKELKNISYYTKTEFIEEKEKANIDYTFLKANEHI